MILLKNMDKTNTVKVEEFMGFFKAQSEIGLLVFNTKEELEKTEQFLTDNGFVLSFNCFQIMNYLKNKQSVILSLSEKITPEIYSLITQYSDRAGEIQMMNPATMVLEQVEFDPKESHLLLLATETIWGKIDEEFDLKNKVGLMERIK